MEPRAEKPKKHPRKVSDAPAKEETQPISPIMCVNPKWEYLHLSIKFGFVLENIDKTELGVITANCLK